MAVAVAALLVVGVILLASWPLLQPATTREAADAASRRADLVAERDRVLAGLKEVDLDLQMGKISGEDHAFLKASLERQAVGALSRLESERRPDGERGVSSGEASREPS